MGRKTPRGVLLKALGLGAGALASWALRRTRYSFQDKVVLVTGGSRGLGLELARRFVAEGAYVALCAREREELEAAQQMLAPHQARVSVHEIDLTDPAQRTQLIDAVVQRHGRLDVLVNNAGIIAVGPFQNSTDEDYARSLEVHFWAPLHLTRAALPHMRKQGGGRIVNISSFGGKIAVPHLAPYSVGKFALSALSASMNAELAQEGIVVTSIFPFLLRTGSVEHAAYKGDPKKEFTVFSLFASTPLLTMSSKRAARRIVEACRAGRAELVMSAQGKLLVSLRSLAPEVAQRTMQLIVPLLPGGPDSEGSLGVENHTPLTRSPLTWLTQRAAERNNEHTTFPNI